MELIDMNNFFVELLVATTVATSSSRKKLFISIPSDNILYNTHEIYTYKFTTIPPLLQIKLNTELQSCKEWFARRRNNRLTE
jgi:hypothetical protein